MPEKQLSAKDMLLSVESAPSTYLLMACSTSHGLNQSSSPITAETFCGQLSKQGNKDATAPFALIPNITPSAGKIAIDNLQDYYDSGVTKNWKMTTAAAVTGDPIISFSGFISELNYDASGEYFNMSGSVKVDPATVTVDFVI